MQAYIGYGFDAYQIKDQAWVDLVKKHDPSDYEDIVEHASKINNDPEDTNELIIGDILNFIDSAYIGRAEYLANIINATEEKDAGTNYIVSTYDDFLVFDSVRFADDSKRTQYIRTQDDFIKMISRYVPIDNITFGNLYEGVEWIDPCFFLE
jgi:hypothetical protein